MEIERAKKMDKESMDNVAGSVGGIKVGKAVTEEGIALIEGASKAELGRKLDYLFGNAIE